MSNIIKELVSPVNKLIEITAKAIGKIYEPIQIKKIAKAQAEAINIYADVVRKNQDILGELKFDGTGVNVELTQRAFDRTVYQETLKQANIEAVLGKTYEELKNAEDCSSEPVNDDWTLRFFKKIEEVSDSDMQLLWAKILAGEIKKPKSFSLRTLEVVSNLNSDDAKLFLKIIPIIIELKGRAYIFRQEKFLESYAVKLEDILRLEDSGLIKSNELNSSLEVDINSKQILCFDNDKILLVENHTAQKKEYNMGIFFITRAGVELYNILKGRRELSVWEDIIKEMKEKNSFLTFSLHKVNYLQEDNINYEDLPILKE